MNGIKDQSSIQAAAIIRDVIKREDLELVVSRSGNVRLAYGPEKFFLRLINAVRSGAREQRIDAAKTAVVNKLTAELGKLGVQIPTVKIPVVKKLALAMAENDDALNTPEKASVSVVEDLIAKSVSVIKHVSEQAKDKTLEYFWKTIAHDRATGRIPDTNRALSVAHKTMEWAQSLRADESSAYKASLNAHQLLQKYEIPLENGKEILLMAGRLSKRHHFSETAALQFAIDNYPVLQGLGVRMDSIERIIKSLDEQIPALRTMAQGTRISAAIRYLQLQSDATADMKPIEEIRLSLAASPLQQSILSKDSKINQIQRSVPSGMTISTMPGALNQHTLTLDPSKTAIDLKNRVTKNLSSERRVASMNEQIARAREISFKNNTPTPPDETELAFADLNTEAMEDWGRTKWIFRIMEQLEEGKFSTATETMDKKSAAQVARKFREFARDLGHGGLQLLAAGMVQTTYGDIFVEARNRYRTASDEAVMLALDRKALPQKLRQEPTDNDSTTIQLTQLPNANIEVKIVSMQRSNILIDQRTGDLISIDSNFQSWNEPLSESNATSITTLKYTLDAESLRKRDWVLIGEPEAFQILQIPTPIT